MESLLELFVHVDDFCQAFLPNLSNIFSAAGLSSNTEFMASITFPKHSGGVGSNLPRTFQVFRPDLASG